jgi:hypothetical protein
MLFLGAMIASPGCESREACRVVEAVGRVTVTVEPRGAQSAFVAVGDCSGDGRPDIINGTHLFVAQSDGTFAASQLTASIPSSAGAATLVDLDDDGVADLVTAGPGVAWLRGEGGCRFAAPVALAPPTPGRASQVLVTDADLDGLTDIAVSYTERSASPVVLLTAWGDGRFVDRTPAFAPRSAGAPYMGYGTFFDDADGDGARDLFVVADFDHGWMGWGRRSDEPAFDRDARLTAAFAESHPMSLCPLDHDRDGRIDYFISGVTDANLLLRATGRRDLASSPGAAPIAPRPTDYAWGCAAFDADLDGWSDLMVASLTGESGGPAPVTLYLNQRDGTFACASAAVLDATVNSQRLVCADFALEGRPACVASDGVTLALVILRDEIAPRGNWVGLRLRGTVSSPDASGARVSLDGAAPPLVVIAGGQSPIGGEHERAVRLAVGAQTSADVTIHWPSGLRQVVRSLRAGQYTSVDEPRAVTVAPRVAPADGASRVEVVVDAAAAGARGAAIDCEGACAWAGPASADAAGRLHRWLQAPSAPGSARVVVSLDGVALTVRPRVRFGP